MKPYNNFDFQPAKPLCSEHFSSMPLSVTKTVLDKTTEQERRLQGRLRNGGKS